MERQIANDFPVDTNGRCFICLNNKVLPQHDLHEVGSRLTASSSQVSVHSLSQYLKMDMSKVFHEKDSIPSELLDTVKRSKLKVSLCQQCSKWNGRLSELFRQLEQIETEVTFYLELIHGNLTSSDENSSKDVFKLDDDADLKIGWSEKLRIAKTLRKEAKHRCFLKLKNIKPRVKVQNLTTNQVISKQERIRFKPEKQQRHFPLNPDNHTLSRSANNFCDAEQHKKESYSDEDGNNYCDDGEASVEGGISENESDNPQTRGNYNRFVTGDNFSNVPIKTEPGAAGTSSNLKKKWNIGIVTKSPAKVLPSSNAVNNIEKLTYVVNPETGKFKCNICSVESIQKQNLKTHYDSVHLKIKHRCNLCGKDFTQSSSYNLHYRTVHVGVRLKCNLCGKCYAEKRSLFRHQQSVHARNNAI